jgi:hypothetical protein
MDLTALRGRLVGARLTRGLLASLGIAAGNKGKWGLANERLAGLAASPSKAPDFGDAELKTTVCDADGRFLESVKVCAYPGDPLWKLEHVYLVLARDLAPGVPFEAREVANVAVVSLRPPPALLAALVADQERLDEDPDAADTEYLEVRPAGASGAGRFAYYLRRDRLATYVSEALAAPAVGPLGT